MTPEQKLADLGITLPMPAAPAANYVPVTRSGSTLYVSGQLPLDNGKIITGFLGQNLDIAAGQKAAECCVLGILSQAVHNGGVALEKMRILKLNGFVACGPDFQDQAAVINGASDLLVKVLGENGKHARAAVGMVALPFGAAVEIDAVIEVLD